jgi:acetyltransferase-like isoleucine patch superfamily enzyme
VGLIGSLFESYIRNIGGAAGRRLRHWYYNKRLGACGKNVVIDTNVIISDPKNVFIGDNVWIDHGVMILAGAVPEGRKLHAKKNDSYRFQRGQLHIGNEVHIAAFVVLQAHGGISIGNRLTIGAGSKLYSLSHHYRDVTNKENNERFLFGSMVGKDKQFLIEGPIVIEDDSAVGLNCIVLPGAIIPKGTWVGVGAIIKDEKLEPGAIYQVKQEWLRKGKDN